MSRAEQLHRAVQGEALRTEAERQEMYVVIRQDDSREERWRYVYPDFVREELLAQADRLDVRAIESYQVTP